MRLSRSLCAVFLVALVARLVAQAIVGAYASPETWEYETIANNLLAGRGYVYDAGGITYTSAVSSPLYVLLTAAVYLGTAHNQAVLLILQALFGAMTAVLAAWLAGQMFGQDALVLTGLLTAVDPALALYAARLHPLTLDALSFLAVVCACVALPLRPRATLLAGVGALLGVAALTRTTVLSLAPLLLLWLRHYKAVRVISWPAAGLIVTAAVIYSPWPARNSLLLGQFVPGSSESTEWLWRGTNAAATGASLTAEGRTMLEAASPEFRAQIAAASEAQRYDVYRAAAIRFVREHPAQAVGLYATKLKAFWWGSDTSGLLYPTSWKVLYEAWYAAVLVLAAIGIWSAWRQPSARGPLLLILACLALVSLSQALFYVEGRHRFAIEPLLLVLSGGGLARIVGRVPLPAWPRRGVRDVANSLS